jgi:molybdenum cofactor biosynthesis enzyme MoaA
MRIQTLSLVVQAGCGAGCPFCIARQTPVVAKSDKVWMSGAADRGLRKAFRLAEIGGCTTALITSKAEPLNNPDQVEDYIRQANHYDMPLVELQTNGMAFQRADFTELLETWRNLGLTTIAISCAGIDDEKNQEIYDPKGTLTMSGYKLAHAVKPVLDAGLMCRLTVTLFKGGVDSVEAVHKVIGYCRDNGIQQVTFGRVTMPESSRNEKATAWVKEHAISWEMLTELRASLCERGTPILSLMHGARVWDVNGVAVGVRECLTRSKQIEEIRSLIYWPDGKITYDWSYAAARLA